MSNPTASLPTCLITGATGYLGGHLKTALLDSNWRVTELTRRPQPAGSSIPFQLGDDLAPASLSGATALVHCAYDFTRFSWPEIHRVNVAGSEKLFQAARLAGIKHLVYISSISAYEGCRSLYGKAKLETEHLAISFGATVIRPGLIWGDPPGAMFGKLVGQVEKARLLPLIVGGRQFQFLVHHRDLSTFICRRLNGQISPPGLPITIAHEQPWTLRKILEEIARVKNKRLSFVPVPWQFVWTGLKCAELCRLPINFRTDNLIGFIYQNPNPSFTEQRHLGLSPRPFALA